MGVHPPGRAGVQSSTASGEGEMMAASQRSWDWWWWSGGVVVIGVGWELMDWVLLRNVDIATY